MGPGSRDPIRPGNRTRTGRDSVQLVRGISPSSVDQGESAQLLFQPQFAPDPTECKHYPFLLSSALSSGIGKSRERGQTRVPSSHRSKEHNHISRCGYKRAGPFLQSRVKSTLAGLNQRITETTFFTQFDPQAKCRTFQRGDPPLNCSKPLLKKELLVYPKESQEVRLGSWVPPRNRKATEEFSFFSYQPLKPQPAAMTLTVVRRVIEEQLFSRGRIQRNGREYTTARLDRGELTSLVFFKWREKQYIKSTTTLTKGLCEREHRLPENVVVHPVIFRAPPLSTTTRALEVLGGRQKDLVSLYMSRGGEDFGSL
ncbi:hypothetical protein V6N11_016328 [Hibiscus sabdariffa]|uniref:Uncharacterized protein n=1 Tax=Hibiscus sabdariffa TaxID=183260 RepID=A0ABR2TUN0_9ROSI